MTLSQIECFIEVVKAGSFSKAATNLFMTQQGVSNQIKALETELGFPVFKRLSRGVTTTDEGNILLEYWEDAYEKIKVGMDKSRDEFHGKSRNIRIGLEDMGKCSEDIMEAFLEYEKTYDDLHIDFEIMTPRRMIEQFDDESLDMAILFDSNFTNINYLNKLPLHDRPLTGRLVYSKKHPLAEKEDICLADFMDYPMGILAKNNTLDYIKVQSNSFKANNLKFNGDFQEYASRRDMEIAISAGRCFTSVFETVFEDNENLTYLDMDLGIEETHVSIFWKDVTMETKTRLLCDILKEKMSRYN